MHIPEQHTETLAQLAREAEFEIFDSLPASYREYLRNGGRVEGYEQAVDEAFGRRLKAWIVANNIDLKDLQ